MKGWYEIRLGHNGLQVHLFSLDMYNGFMEESFDDNGEVILSFNQLERDNTWYVSEINIGNPTIEPTCSFAIEVLRNLDGKDLKSIPDLIGYLNSFLVPMEVEPVGNA